MNQRGVEREEHGDALDLEVAARDPVTVPEVSDLDLEVQLLVVLVAKGSEAAGLQRPVRRELLGQVIAVAGNQGADPSEEGDRAFAFLRHRCGGGRGGEEHCERESHLR